MYVHLQKPAFMYSFSVVYVLRQCLSLGPGVHWDLLIGWPVNFRDLISFASLALGLQVCVITADFCVGSGDQIQVPMLLQQALW